MDRNTRLEICVVIDGYHLPGSKVPIFLASALKPKAGVCNQTAIKGSVMFPSGICMKCLHATTYANSSEHQKTVEMQNCDTIVKLCSHMSKCNHAHTLVFRGCSFICFYWTTLTHKQ